MLLNRQLGGGKTAVFMPQVWDARQGGFHNIRREIETHSIEWMSVACGRQA